MFHTALRWLKQHENVKSQITPHTTSPWRASYGVYFVRIPLKIDRVITAPHCALLHNVSCIYYLPAYTTRYCWILSNRYYNWCCIDTNNKIIIIIEIHSTILPIPSLFINLLWPYGDIDLIKHRSGSKLVKVMACCLSAPNHYLNQCWLIISEHLKTFSQEMLNKSIPDMSLKIINTNLQAHLPGASE